MSELTSTTPIEQTSSESITEAMLMNSRDLLDLMRSGRKPEIWEVEEDGYYIFIPPAEIAGRGSEYTQILRRSPEGCSEHEYYYVNTMKNMEEVREISDNAERDDSGSIKNKEWQKIISLSEYCLDTCLHVNSEVGKRIIEEINEIMEPTGIAITSEHSSDYCE